MHNYNSYDLLKLPYKKDNIHITINTRKDELVRGLDLKPIFIQSDNFFKFFS